MQPQPDTLVILTPGFPVNESDSTCLPAQQQFVRALNNYFPSLRVIVVAFQFPFTGLDYEWHGNRVMPLNGRNRNKIYRLLTWSRAWLALRKLKKSHPIMGLFSFWCTECALVGRYFSKVHEVPHFTWILGQDAREMNRFFIKLIRPSGQELVAMSDFLSGEFYRNHAIRPQHVIPNGIDAALYKTGPVTRDIDLLGAGSLIPLKQYDLFIRVVRELTRLFPTLQARICGIGAEYHNLQLLVRLLKLKDSVQLMGEQSHGEVLQLMQRTRIFLHTSSYEGYSSVCLEALYAGAHVISFCRPMTAGIDHWHIVGDREEMIAKALELLADPELDHHPVLVNSMEDTARAVVRLFAEA